MTRPLWRILATLFALSLFAAACAGDDDDDTSAGDDSGDTDDGGGGGGEVESVDVFPLPPVGDSGEVVLTGGTFAGAFSADEETMAVLEFMASPEYVERRLEAGVGGFLSANQNVDLEAYSGFEQTLVEILQNAEAARFDGSDDMVAEVGAGTFWTAATDIVSGNASVEDAFGEVESGYPEVPEIAECPEPEIGPGDGTVTIFGPEVEQEQQGFQDAFAAFTEETGITVEVQGDRSCRGADRRAGPGRQPARRRSSSRSRACSGPSSRTASSCRCPTTWSTAMQENFVEGFIAGGQVGDQFYGVPNKSDVKSPRLVLPGRLRGQGLRGPRGPRRLRRPHGRDGRERRHAAVHRHRLRRRHRLAVHRLDRGLHAAPARVPTSTTSGSTTRSPSTTPQVVEVGEFVMDIWEADGYVFGGPRQRRPTPFAEAGLGIIEGDCMMHRQAQLLRRQLARGHHGRLRSPEPLKECRCRGSPSSTEPTDPGIAGQRRSPDALTTRQGDSTMTAPTTAPPPTGGRPGTCRPARAARPRRRGATRREGRRRRSSWCSPRCCSASPWRSGSSTRSPTRR